MNLQPSVNQTSSGFISKLFLFLGSGFYLTWLKCFLWWPVGQRDFSYYSLRGPRSHGSWANFWSIWQWNKSLQVYKFRCYTLKRQKRCPQQTTWNQVSIQQKLQVRWSNKLSTAIFPLKLKMGPEPQSNQTEMFVLYLKCRTHFTRLFTQFIDYYYRYSVWWTV